MPRIADMLAQGRTLSFEFFAPKTEDGDEALAQTLVELELMDPSFVSVTYGAAGSNREHTFDIVVDVKENHPVSPMAHLTSWGHTRDELRQMLAGYREAGIENILALRGDPPRDDPGLPLGDLSYASDLVELAREVGDGSFSIGVAAHPEGHPLSADLAVDRKHLAYKLSLADFAITQFFFRSDDYLRMMDDLTGLGVDKPVLAGIMPVTNVGQIERFAKLSGADFPTDLAARLHAVEDDEAEVRRIGTEVAVDICQTLIDAGVPGLHFYTLNRSAATLSICEQLGSWR